MFIESSDVEKSKDRRGREDLVLYVMQPILPRFDFKVSKEGLQEMTSGAEKKMKKHIKLVSPVGCFLLCGRSFRNLFLNIFFGKKCMFV